MNSIAKHPTQRLDKLLLLICVSSIFVVGCPQNPGNNPPGGTGHPPVARAGADQVVNAGASVTLDGSGSSDPDGDVISFLWKQTLGTTVSLSSTSASIVTFVAPANGTSLTFELKVNDGQDDSVAKVNVSVHPVEPLVQVVEIRQPTVKDDPAITGHFPVGWTIASTVSGPHDPEETGAPDGVERIQYAPTIEIVLSPGASKQSEFLTAGPALLTGVVRWIGTTDPLPVTLSLDGTSLATGDSYSIGTDRGGSVARRQTTAGGQATLSVTNTSQATVTVEIILGAFAL